MKSLPATHIALAALALLLFSGHCSAQLPPQQIAPGVYVQSGEFKPGLQPDGNSVLLRTSRGWIAVDTGRHAAHTQRLMDFAAGDGGIAAVINTHWHLDHIGGNALLRQRYPQVRIYASGALEHALQGFLANYRRDLESALQQQPTPEKRQPLQTELALLALSSKLAPDEVIASSVTRDIAGRSLQIHLEGPAVTEGDVWLFDSASRVLIAGDLVTLPVPLFDTACPQGWRDALGRLERIPFDQLVPGHGQVLDRAGFRTYRQAFDELLECAASDRPDASCIEGWLKDAQTLIAQAQEPFAKELATYYVSKLLRNGAARGKYCSTRP